MLAKTQFRNPKLPKLLVIGGTGRLGRMLRAAWSPSSGLPLEKPGFSVIWQSRRDDGSGDVVFDPLADPEAFADHAAQADALLLLAGVVAGPPEALAQNATLGAAACAAAQAANVPLVAASSAAVYGRAGMALNEAALCEPVSGYGRSKLEMEAAIAPLGVRGCALRIGNVAGADALLGMAAPEGGRKLHVFADGRAPQRSYIGPLALAAAIARAVDRMIDGRGLPALVNLALPDVVGMDDLLRAAGEGWLPVPAPPEAIARVELDVGRAVAAGLIASAPVDATAIIADMRRIKEGLA